MLHNLDWLKPGQIFPPRSEIFRLKAYEDNKQLFEGHIAPILKPYLDCHLYLFAIDRVSIRFSNFDKTCL